MSWAEISNNKHGSSGRRCWCDWEEGTGKRVRAEWKMKENRFVVKSSHARHVIESFIMPSTYLRSGWHIALFAATNLPRKTTCKHISLPTRLLKLHRDQVFEYLNCSTTSSQNSFSRFQLPFISTFHALLFTNYFFLTWIANESLCFAFSLKHLTTHSNRTKERNVAEQTEMKTSKTV